MSPLNILNILLSFLFLLLTACGGGGGGGGSAPVEGSISGTATDGPMSNATVTAYAIANGQMGAQLASATTDANGNFNMPIGGYSGAVLLQMSGGTYTDEATGTTMSMAPGDVMTAVLPTMSAGMAASGVQVTPVTSMAQAMAQHMTGGMTNANIATANTAVGSYFMVGDILHVHPMNPLVAGSGTGASQDSQNYGMALAAISQSAQILGMTSSSAMITALMNDASDGVMDGKAGTSTVQMGGMMGSMAMPATAGTSGLGAAMNTFMTSARNMSGVTTTSLMTALMGTDGQMLGTIPAFANTTVSGTVFDGTMSKGTVTAYAVNNGAMGAQIASVSMDSLGNYTLPLGTYTGAVMLRMSGGTYTDEATGTTMSMAPGDVMTAILPTISAGTAASGVQVTPVTSMAQAMAQHLAGGMTDANIAAANTAMGNYFMVSDILHTQPINPVVAGSGVGASQDARNYGVTIAAMSEYAQAINMTLSSTLVTAMMNDASDGVMNGMMGSTSISMSMGGMMGMGMMASTAGTSGLATAMTDFMNSPENASGLTVTDMSALNQKLNSSNGQI